MSRVVDLMDPDKNEIYNMSVEESARSDPDGRSGTDQEN